MNSKTSIVKDENSPIGVSIQRITRNEIEHKSKLLCAGSNRIIIVGASGSGKSTVMLQIIPMFSNKLTHILLGTVKSYDDAHSSIEKYCKEQNIYFTKFGDGESASEVINETLNAKKESDHALIIFDDYATSYNSQSNDPENKVMIQCYSLLRSFNTSMICITQSYQNIPTRVRNNSNMLICFRMKDTHGVNILLNDIYSSFVCGDESTDKATKAKIREMYKKIVFDQPHEWIMVIDNPPQIRHKWNTIIYPDDLKGSIVGGSVDKSNTEKFKRVPVGIIKKRDLFKQALELGIPSYTYRKITVPQLEQFIQIKSAQGQKMAGNTASELDEILKPKVVPKNEHIRLLYLIRKYKKSQNPEYLNKIIQQCELLIDEGTDKAYLDYILSYNHLDKLINFD